VVDSFDVGGTESQVAQTARRLNGGRFEVTVACLRARGPLLDLVCDAEIPVVEFDPGGSLLSWRGLKQYRGLLRFIRRRRFHVVHAHDLWSNLLAVPSAWAAGTPVIISSRRDLGHLLPWYTPWRRRIILRIQMLCTVILANSEAVRDHLVTWGLPPDRIRVIQNGVDYQEFADAARDRSKVFPGLSPSAKVVAVVANMRSLVKGHEDLIEAARILRDEGQEAHFALIGEGELQPELERRIQSLGLTTRFTFLGRRRDVPEVLAVCDLAALPSRAEGFPNALLEYMACGLPTVATRVGGCVEIIEDGRHGPVGPPPGTRVPWPARSRACFESPSWRAGWPGPDRNSCATPLASTSCWNG
jgi:glycosyltransferase involved in cell wall biosynthesis